MARKSPRKTPEQIAAELLAKRLQDFHAVGLPAGLAALPAGSNIEITRTAEKREGQTVEANSARRLDAFTALRRMMEPGCYDAGRKYEHQMLVRRGENDRRTAMERVDRTSGLTSDAMVDAALWLEAVDAMLSRRDRRMLLELIEPTKAWASWRDLVQAIAGEKLEHAQAAAVRAMAVNLRDAIDEVERLRAATKRPKRAA
jgi:hypothetical protein